MEVNICEPISQTDYKYCLKYGSTMIFGLFLCYLKIILHVCNVLLKGETITKSIF